VPSENDTIWAEAIEDARFAPSSHNTQPWTFRRTARGLELVADGTRALSAVDPGFRELVISGGAVLHHLRAALGARGHHAALQLLPEDTDEPVLARLRMERGAGETAELATLGGRSVPVTPTAASTSTSTCRPSPSTSCSRWRRARGPR
jgi:nitroreductase